MSNRLGSKPSARAKHRRAELRAKSRVAKISKKDEKSKAGRYNPLDMANAVKIDMRRWFGEDDPV